MLQQPQKHVPVPGATSQSPAKAPPGPSGVPPPRGARLLELLLLLPPAGAAPEKGPKGCRGEKLGGRGARAGEGEQKGSKEEACQACCCHEERWPQSQQRRCVPLRVPLCVPLPLQPHGMGTGGWQGAVLSPGRGLWCVGAVWSLQVPIFHAVTAEPEASSPVELSAVPSQGQGAEDKLQVGLASAPGALPALEGLSKLGFVSLEIGQALRCVCLSSRT